MTPGAGYLRLEAHGEALYYFFNAGRQWVSIARKLENAELEDVLTGRTLPSDINLGPKSYLWLKPRNGRESTGTKHE